MHLTLNNTSYYAYTGARELRPGQDTVVFAHGAAMDHTVWAHQSRHFAYHGCNVAALDLPGHRFSGGAALDSIPALAAWLNQFIAKMLGPLGGGAAHIVGHSMGALTALEAAATWPAGNPPLRTLSLLGFSYPMRVAPRLMEAAQHTPSEACAMMTQWSHCSKIGGEPVPGFWAPGMQMSMMANSAEGAIHACLRACDSYDGGEAALAKVTCPMLFLSGRQDKMAPAKLAVELAARHERAEAALLPDCGHSVMAESPDGVLEALKEFIGRHSGEGAAGAKNG